MFPICEFKIDRCIIIRYWREGSSFSIRVLSGKGDFKSLKAFILLGMVLTKVLKCSRYVNAFLMDVKLSDI